MSPADRRADEGWWGFDAALEPLEWGDGTYVIVLPDALGDAASAARRGGRQGATRERRVTAPAGSLRDSDPDGL